MKVFFDKQIRVFWYMYAVFFGIAGVILLLTQKGDTVLFINRYATHFFDIVFQLITWLGTGWLFLPLSIGLFFYRYTTAIAATVTISLTGIFTWFFKQILFSGEIRPTLFLGKEKFTHIIEGFNYHHYNSFPSGHTTAAFSFFLLLAWLLHSKKYTIVFFILAALAGFSRMYLLQHFLIDVFLGSMLGCLSAILGVKFALWLEKKYPVLKKKISFKLAKN